MEESSQDAPLLGPCETAAIVDGLSGGIGVCLAPVVSLLWERLVEMAARWTIPE